MRRAATAALCFALAGCSSTIEHMAAGQCGAPVAAAPAVVSGPQKIWRTLADATAASDWRLTLAGEDVRLALVDGDSLGGTLTHDDGTSDAVDAVEWDAPTGRLAFRAAVAGGWRWIEALSVDGVLTGRASFDAADATRPADPTRFSDHVTGWSEQAFESIAPRSFDITVGSMHGRLRIDRDPVTARGFVARWKQLATDDNGAADEQPELDATVARWDGTQLSASFTDGSGNSGSITARGDVASLTGTFDPGDGSGAQPPSGRRIELLGFGLGGASAADRATWQARTRRQLMHLMMADNPSPTAMRVERHPFAIFPDGHYVPGRDDNPAQHPMRYTMDELDVEYTVPGPNGAMTRTLHGFVTTPTTAPPPCGWPILVSVNGHDGSAQNTLTPSATAYWYGDAWARRGYVVVAIDIGHRPYAERSNVYFDYPDGDAPEEGNGLHPSIAAPGFDSDFEEDGERVWDVERAVELADAEPNTDGSRVVVTGLSMGGEVTTFSAALDPRVSVAIPAGFTPDLEMLPWMGNHACWRWQHGSVIDYISSSDLHALVAPRALVVESGVLDNLFSEIAPPFVDGKEVTRRSRDFFVDAPASFVFYLHDTGHAYHFGDAFAAATAAVGVLVPVVIGPRAPGDVTWSADATRVSIGKTLPQKVRASSAVPPPKPAM